MTINGTLIDSRAMSTRTPRLRGWLHGGTAPVALTAGIVLLFVAPSGEAMLAAAVYTLTSALLFTVSAIYHIGRWSPRVGLILKRADHGNIYLMIAGSFTPIAVLGLPDPTRSQLLAVMWSGAAIGVAFRWAWPTAPRALYTILYLALGWSVVPAMGALLQLSGAKVPILVACGGVLYTLGAIVYATKRPNLSLQWFGFHEVFHSLTIAAWISQYVAIYLLVRAAN